MNQHYGLWLIPLLGFAICLLIARFRVKWSWGWSHRIQAIAVSIVAIIGLTVGSNWDWICAGVGWFMAVTFFIVPATLVSKLENSIALLNSQGALRSADLLQYFYWGKPGKFWMDMAKAYGFFIKGDGSSAESILTAWQDQSDTPPELKELITSYRQTGHVILWDWQGIVDNFEQMQNRSNAANQPASANKITRGNYLSASRAYAELGRGEEATRCIEHAGLVDIRMPSKGLALTLLPCLCLLGGLDQVNQLRPIIIEDGREAFPEYSDYYWLGRCLTARGEFESARAAFEQAVHVLESGAPNSSAWMPRIKFQMERMEATRQAVANGASLPDWSNQIARIWRIFQQSQFVQEIVAPKKSSPVVASLSIAIVAVFIVFWVLTHIHSDANTMLAEQLLRSGMLDPKSLLAGQYWRLFSYLFLHKDEMHCFVNVVGLYWFGRIAQNIFGTTRFLFIYFVAGALSGVLHSLLQPDLPAIGASGAVMGVFGAVAVGIYRLKNELPDKIRRTELMWMGGLAITQLVLDHIIPRVAVFAHLGGLVAGVVFGMIVAVPRPPFQKLSSSPSDGRS
jgi:membrane associated rhomboid family serine protease